MDKEDLYEQMAQYMKESLKIIVYLDKVYINGLMADSMLGNEKIIKWKEEAFSFGKMEENMKVSI